MTGKVILLGGVTNPAQSSVSGAMTFEWLNHIEWIKHFFPVGGSWRI